MVATEARNGALMQGHVALYARDRRWLRATANGLAAAGHTYQQASTPAEIHTCLQRQRFDALVLKVRDEDDARSLLAEVNGARLPPHAVLVGSASALLLTARVARGGTFRYVPGRTATRDIVRLVGLCISAGVPSEHLGDEDHASGVEEVNLRDAIEQAASTAYAEATRKRQRFHTAVHPQDAYVVGSPPKLRRAIAALLNFVVGLAPRGAVVSVEAESEANDWLIRIEASAKAARGSPAGIVDELREAAHMLSDVSSALREQGGILWVEVAGPTRLGLCLTLPLSRHELQSAS